MQRRTLLTSLASGFTALTLASNARSAAPFPLKKTATEWKALVSAAAYGVLFDHGTERTGSSPLNAEKRAGSFVCAACFLPLFDAAHKYESGTGWPSFFDVRADAIGTRTDYRLILP